MASACSCWCCSMAAAAARSSGVVEHACSSGRPLHQQPGPVHAAACMPSTGCQHGGLSS
jgi:hypothetical protein